MAQCQMRQFLVLNRRQQLVGMVALRDLAVHAGTQPVMAEVLAQVSEPGKAGRK
jgi:predicted transcriptional regulator